MLQTPEHIAGHKVADLKKRNLLMQPVLAIVINIEEKQRTHTGQSPPSQSSAGQKARVLELKGILGRGGTLNGWDPGVPRIGRGGESWGESQCQATGGSK